jgi:plastocyanin
MRFGRLATALIAGGLALGVALPAQAATKSISIVNTSVGFDPDPVSGAEGTTFAWTNNDSVTTHTSTQDSPLALWNTGNISPGVTKTVTVASAGAYPYHCNIHPFMTGTVRVPIKVSATTGHVGDSFTITMATTNATGTFVYDVQERVGSGSWKSFKTAVTARTAPFKAPATGTFSFRSRLRNTAVANAASGWSPKKTITVG